MSWENRINNVRFSITCGDGKEYFPLWQGGTKDTEFNVGVFDFINVSGSLIERKLPRGASIPLTFWFDGSNNIEQSQAFENSAKDPRVWTVNHPFYGIIKGQPLRITRNDENLNITAVTVDFWESIDVDYPNSNFNVKDNSLERKIEIQQSIAESFSSKDLFESADIVKLKETNLNNSSSFTNAISENPSIADGVFANYQNATARASKSADNLLNNSFDAIVQAQALLEIPSRIETSVDVRLNGFKQAYNKSKTILNTIAGKLLFESNSGAIIANYANASVNPLDSDYQVITQIQSVASDLIAIYSDYLATLDSASVSIYDTENAWQPNAIVQSQLYDMVVFTVANLFNLGFDSQQERVVYTEKETNLILLVHRYLGMDVNDENLERFRQINQIKMNENFKIRKGRKIVYYV
jgi:hypothetical protein